MSELTPAVKLLLSFRKEWLITLAKELNLSTDGTKIVLAKRIAEKQEEEQTRIWNAIANPRRKS